MRKIGDVGQGVGSYVVGGKSGWGTAPPVREEGGCLVSPGVSCLLDLEVEDIGDLEVCPIEQNQIAADHDVRVIGRGRRKHSFQVGRAGLNPLLKPRRQRSTDHQLALQPGRKTITLGQARREI